MRSSTYLQLCNIKHQSCKDHKVAAKYPLGKSLLLRLVCCVAKMRILNVPYIEKFSSVEIFVCYIFILLLEHTDEMKMISHDNCRARVERITM